MDAIQAGIEAAKANQTQVVDPIQASIDAAKNGTTEAAPSGAAPQAAGGVPRPTPRKKDPDSFSSSIGRAVDNLQANFGGTAEALGEITGIDALAEAGGQYRDEQKAEAAQYGLPSIGSVFDINSVGDAGSWLGETATAALPSLATTLGSGAAAAKVAPAAWKIPAAMGGAFAAAFGNNVGDVQNKIKELNPDAEASFLSLGAGTAISALDVVGAGAVAKPLLKSLGKDLTEKALIANGVKQSVAKEAVKAAGVGAVAEGATGGIQSLMSDVAAASVAGVDLNKDDVLENAINAMVGGAVLGGGASSVAGAVAADKSNSMLPGSARESSTFEDGSKTPQTTAGRIFHGLGSSSIRMLEPWARHSTAAKEFIRSFRPDMTGKTATDTTIFEDARLKSADWKVKLEEIKDEAGGMKNFQQILDDYQNNDIPQTKAAQKLKDLLDEVHTYAKTEANLSDIGKIDKFLPVSASPEIVKGRYDEFLQKITPYFKDAQKAQDSLDTWLDKADFNETNNAPKIARMVEQNSNGDWVVSENTRLDKDDPDSARFKVGQTHIPPVNTHLEKSRTFANVPQSILTEFSKEAAPKTKLDNALSPIDAVTGADDRIYNAIGDYLESAAHRTAFSKRFGARGDLANGMVLKAIKQAQAAGYNPSKVEVNRMYDLLDSYNGMLNRIEDQGWKTATSAVGAALTIKTLPLAALSTLVETMTPAIRGTMWDAILSAAPAMAEMAKMAVRPMFNGKPRTEFATIAANAGISWEAATNVAAQRLGVNMYTRTAAKATTGFFIANGLTAATLATRIYAAKTGDRIFMNALKDLTSVLPMDSARAQQSVTMLRSMGVDVRSRDDALALYSPSTPSQIAWAREMRTKAMHRFATQAVLEPTSADLPMWMSDGTYQLVAMLHRYPSAFTNTILPQLGRRASPEWNGGVSGSALAGLGSAFIVGMMISLGYVQDELKMIAKSGEIDYDDTRTGAQRFNDILNQTVMPGHASWIMDFFAAPRYGSSGLGALGPVAGFVEEAGKSIYNFANNPNEGAIYQYLYKQTPFQFYRPGRETVGEWEVLD